MTRFVGGQRDAVQVHDRPLLVEAGAGTGKTWTLVQRFLYLLDQHPDWPLESVVAVTFTEKAAREMRTRLRKEIEKQAAAAPAESHWHDRRHSLVNLQVGTIHSLCARILRENSIAAGVDPRFEVLDEQQAEALQEAAIRQAMDEFALSESPALDLLSGLQLRDLRDQVAGLLSRRGTVQRLFSQLEDPWVLLEKWIRGFSEMQQAVWAEAAAGAAAALELVPQVAILDEADKLAQTVGLAQVGCSRIQQGDLRGACQAWLEINLRGGKAANWGGKDSLDEIKQLLKVLREAAKLLDSAGCLNEIGELDVMAAQALQHWRDLWNYTTEVYNRLKNERQVLDFDDLELLAEELLHQQPRDPRLQDYLDSLNQLMVDEYQDTNEVQWRILYALAHPSAGGRLFVVGDAKQSIYRFRQAQVTVFNQTAKDIQAETGALPVRLDHSFRTHQTLTNALNALFDGILKPISSSYQDYEAQPGPLQAVRAAPESQSAAPAPVELWLLPSQDDQGNKLFADDARILEAQILAQRLIELERSSFLVWDKDQEHYRPFRFGDACILFRATTNLPLYEEQFKAAGLPYLTVSGRGYFDRPEVRDLIALLSALNTPADDLNLAVALRSPMFGLSDETLYRLRWHTPDGSLAEDAVPFATALRSPPLTDQVGEVHFAGQVLDQLWQAAGRIDPWRLLRMMLDLTGYEAALVLSDRDAGGSGRSRSNVLKLLEMARQRSTESLSVFLNGLHDLSAREAREGEALGSAPESGAVMLMSIHAAKGLEFPVVVVADLGRRLERMGSNPLILHDPEIGLVCKQRDGNGDWQKPASYSWGEWLLNRMEKAESKRLLYVACTRAADLLILSGKPGEKNSWLSQVESIWGVEEEPGLKMFDGFSVRVEYPTTLTLVPAVVPSLDSADGPPEVPDLAQPVPARLGERHFAVTHMRRALNVDETGEPADLYPAVRVQGQDRRIPRPAMYLIGRVVHRALANWDSLSLPVPELEKRLVAFAHREKIRHPEAVAYAVDRSLRMLAVLKRTAIFQEINSSVQRHTEVPFSLSSPLGQLHGVIDLLYLDQQGIWQMVDWKTDWFPQAELLEQAAKHRRQIAIYDSAARQVLKVEPVVRVCFLAINCQLIPYQPEELAQTRVEIFALPEQG